MGQHIYHEATKIPERETFFNPLAIGRRGSEIGFLVSVSAIRACFLLLRRVMDRDKQPLGELLGVQLARLFEALGPTFIKLGQALSSRPDLLPPDLVRPLARLQDQLAPFDTRQIPALLAKSFGSNIEVLFKEFDLVPVSAASIAQVHRARLADGREVAVKIRRPGVDVLIEQDLQLMRFCAKALSVLPWMRHVPMLDLIDDLGLPILQQLDFKLEAANTRRFRSHFANRERIKIPSLIEELCSDTVLTMEYLDGLQKVTSSLLSPEERKDAALAGLRALYKMIFLDGFIHADMHPGNVFIRNWGEFVILDTGLVARLDRKDQRDFVDFFFGLVNNNGRECARIVYDNATYHHPNCDRKAFEAAMIHLIARHAALKSHEFEITTFVAQLIETQRRFKIRGSTKFMMTILAMVVFDGICKQLYPECDFQAEARGFLIMARYGHLAPWMEQRNPARTSSVDEPALLQPAN